MPGSADGATRTNAIEASGDPERDALMQYRTVNPSSETNLKLIKRIRALVLKLLPVEVEPDSLAEPTSRVLTPAVIKSFSLAAGDFEEALPYCLLRARQTFVWDANHSPADYDENMARAMACEVLARRIVHLLSPDRLNAVMSKRFRYREWGGDDSSAISALETAIDQHCTVFLSSNEAQKVVESLWRGDWVQKNNDEFDIEYVPYSGTGNRTFWTALDPSRLSVPRYQNWLRIFLWLFFLFVYSQTVQQPLERLDPQHDFDAWEGLLYTMAFAFSIEELTRMYKNLRYYTWKIFTFWSTVSLITDGLLLTAFSFRIAGLAHPDGDQAVFFHLRSFQVLSCVAPLIWMKLITVVDGFKYIGTLQICVSRMLQESTIFFALLMVLAVGFMQAMIALDVADGSSDQTGMDIFNLLLQALLQSPDFTMSVAGTSKFGLMLFYLWNAVTSIILLNILISLFSSAYADVTDDAEAEFMSFFAHKTVDMIRAPDNFVYPAPFNLIEIFFVIPLEVFISRESYAKLNRVVMSIVFFIPLVMIALFESHLDTKRSKFLHSLFAAAEEGEEDQPENQDPTCDGHEGEISKVKFDELISAFPNCAQSSEESITQEIHDVKKQLEEIRAMLDKEKEK